MQMKIQGRTVDNDTNPEVQWALFYTLTVLIINLSSQLATGLHAVSRVCLA